MNTNIAFNGENFKVLLKSQTVRGMPQEFEIVERPLIVLCIPFISKERAILVSQYRASINDSSLEFPAGRVANGEDLQSAIRRELIEEVGVITKTIEYVGQILTAPHFSDEEISIFVAVGSIEHKPKPTEKEDALQTILVPWKSINQLIKEGRMSDAKSIAAIGLVTATGILHKIFES